MVKTLFAADDDIPGLRLKLVDCKFSIEKYQQIRGAPSTLRLAGMAK
jgi:hypothetical protein